MVEEELAAALGAAPSARVGTERQGYRHGTRERTLTTSLGATTFAMPRARMTTPEGGTAEWRSELVPRYQRRSERVDEAILGVYLSGTNARRIKGPLAPNALERINGEIRRRTKTQASLPGQDAVLLLLFGLLRRGQVKLRKIDGWPQMDG